MAGSAHAQSPQDTLSLEQTAQARALFEEGLDLAAHKQWDLAADRFRRSSTLHESPVVAYNLAASLIELGHIVAGGELLRQVESAPGASEEVRSAARSLLARAQARIAKLTVLLDGDAHDVSVRVDDKPLHPVVLGVAIPIDPGTHRLQAVRSQQTVATTTVTLADGSSEVAHLRLQPWLNASLTGARDASAAKHDAQRTPIYKSVWFWGAVVGVVAASVTAAVIVSNGDSRRPTSTSPIAAGLALP
jgi:hypothetical protein